MPSFLTVHKHWLIGAIITFLGAFLRIYFPTVVWEAKNIRYRLVTPWFDHPPLFGLLVGLFALLGGAKTFFDCSLTIIRVPSLFLGIASIVLVYLLALKLSNLSIAIIASLIYATNPNTVFLSRLAISENLMIIFCLFIILLYWQYYQTKQKKYLYIAACLAGLACLVKVTAIYLVVLALPVILYTLILVATGAQSHFFTWYMIPFYPFMFIILGIFLDDFRQETDGLTASIIFIFLGVWSIHLNLTAWILASPYGRYYFMIGTAAILGVFYLKDIFGLFKKFWIDRFTFLLFLALLAANINVVLTYKFSG